MSFEASTFPPVEWRRVLSGQIVGDSLEDFDAMRDKSGSHDRLQKYAGPMRLDASEFEDSVKIFEGLGGTFAMTDDDDSITPEPGPKGYHDETGPLVSRQTLLLRPGDIVIPVCHEGMNRSQTMHCLAEALARLSAEAWPDRPRIAVMPPHGAETGCDPHTAYKDLTEENYFGYLYSPINPSSDPAEWQHRCHRAVFGRDKVDRFGLNALRESRRIHSINYTYDPGVPISMVERTRQAQRYHMNITLYSPDWLRGWAYYHEPASGEAGAAGGAAAGGASGAGARAGAATDGKGTRRIVFLCFMRGGPIVIRRLVEACQERGAGADKKPLSGVCVACLPLGDNISRAGAEHNDGTPEANERRSKGNQLAIEKTLEQYSRIVRTLLPAEGNRARDAISARLRSLRAPAELQMYVLRSVDGLREEFGRWRHTAFGKLAMVRRAGGGGAGAGAGASAGAGAGAGAGPAGAGGAGAGGAGAGAGAGGAGAIIDGIAGGAAAVSGVEGVVGASAVGTTGTRNDAAAAYMEQGVPTKRQQRASGVATPPNPNGRGESLENEGISRRGAKGVPPGGPYGTLASGSERPNFAGTPGVPVGSRESNDSDVSVSSKERELLGRRNAYGEQVQRGAGAHDQKGASWCPCCVIS